MITTYANWTIVMQASRPTGDRRAELSNAIVRRARRRHLGARQERAEHPPRRWTWPSGPQAR
jgi:hypothetical protein